MMGRPESHHGTSSQVHATPDGLDNYNILEEIGRGSTTIVHRAICKRGRLRDRQVAVKIIHRTPSNASILDSTSLHQALHHPAILSLFSMFSSPKANYHVLELCSRGTLSDYLDSRDPPILSECELRGILKSLTDALLYLRKERVIHRDIKTSNILLTDDYRVKLADFSLATRPPTVRSTTSTFCGSPSYVSPEIVSRLPYSFGTDLWSLGCVMITCLSGNPPFEPDEISEISKVASASYRLPRTVSLEAKELTVGLLQVDPAHRIPLHRITSHPFFSPAFPITPLGQTLSRSVSRVASSKPFTRQPSRSQNDAPRLLPFPPKQGPRNRARHSDVPPPFGKRRTLGNIGNLDLRQILSDEVSSDVKFPAITGSARRIVSDPTPRLAGSLASDPVLLRPETPSITLSKESHTSEQDALGKQLTFPCINHPLLSPPNTNHGSAQANEIPQSHPRFWTVFPGHETDVVSMSSDVCNVVPPKNTEPTVAVGTTRPLHFTTCLLKAQTHKTIHGQITILPSRSLLADFREGERRRGKKGDQVFVIDPDGMKVKIYNAPHLSSPCCLVEPIAVYSTEDLPSAYWKQYNDAGSLIEQIKQKTPKFVMYKSEVKCTLMANGPPANIELLFQSCPNRKHGSGETQKPCMRIRLCRQNHSLEIARYVSGSQGGEWTKKVLVFTRDMGIGKADLDATERDGIKCLFEFLQVIEAVEFLDREGRPAGADKKAEDIGQPSLPTVTPWSVPSATDRPHVVSDNPKIHQSSSTSSIVKSLSRVTIPPRPAKLGLATTHTHGESNRLPQVVIESTAQSHSLQSAGISYMEELPAEGYSITATIQTRFIPSVGWCIHYGSKVSQGGRYRILFLDGVVLDVDVDEEWVEFKNREGDVTRHGIRDCSKRKKIGERMKVFEEFVSMFDDDA